MIDERNRNVSDREFHIIKSFVEDRTEAELILFICENFNSWVKDIPKDLADYIITFHQKYRFWGNFDPEKEDIELIQKRAAVLKNRWGLIEEFYHSLSDFRSKDILIMILENWLSFHFGRIQKVKEYNFKSYFDMDLLKVSEEEVFVDLGAWKGDTIDDYMATYGKSRFKKIYSYEILKDNIDLLEKRFSEDKRIIIRPVGVSDQKGIMYLSDNGTTDAQALVEEGKTRVETVTLDEDIEEKITFLKMDIEGAEKAAIRGAKRHLQEDKPKLAISIYHSNEDLVDIFWLIRQIQPDYKFYLRYNGLPYFPTDYILIGVPYI